MFTFFSTILQEDGRVAAAHEEAQDVCWEYDGPHHEIRFLFGRNELPRPHVPLPHLRPQLRHHAKHNILLRLARFWGTCLALSSLLRGVASPQLVQGLGDYLVFLTVYSNRTSGESVWFKMYDDSECRHYPSSDKTFAFIGEGSVGTPAARS